MVEKMAPSVDLKALKKAPLGRRVAEGPKIRTQKEKRTETANFSGQLQTLVEFLQNDESLNYSELLSAVEGLTELFKRKLPAELKKLVKEVGDMDAFDVEDAVKYLEEQATISGKSLTEMLDILKKDDDEGIRQQAALGEHVLSIRAKMVEAKPKLRELALELLTQLKTNQDQEVKMTDEEIEAYEAKFRVTEPKELSYEEYTRGLAEKYAAKLEATQTVAAQEKKELEELLQQVEAYWKTNPQADRFDYRWKNKNYTSWRNSREELPATLKKQIQRLETEKMVRGFAATEFFEEAKKFMDEHCGNDEAKKRDFLSRIAGVSKPAMPVMQVSLQHEGSLAEMDSELIKEFGNEVKPLMEKFLESRLLSSISCEESYDSQTLIKNANRKALERYYSFAAGVQALDLDELRKNILAGTVKGADLRLADVATLEYRRNQANRDRYGDNESDYEIAHNNLKALDNGVQAVMKANPDVLSKVELVIRTAGGDKMNHSPFYDTGYGASGYHGISIIDSARAKVLPLSESDGVFYEDHTSFDARKKEMADYEKRLSTYIAEQQAPGSEPVIVTREDLRLKYEKEVEQARQTYLGIKAAADAALQEGSAAMRTMDRVRAEKEQALSAVERERLAAERARAESGDLVGRTEEMAGTIKELSEELQQTRTKLGELRLTHERTALELKGTKESLAAYDKRAKNTAAILERGKSAGVLGRKAVIEEAATAVWNLPQ